MDWVKEDLEAIWHPCSQMKDYEDLPPIIIDYAKGIHLYDKDGKAYMDLISSWWCNLLGHNNIRINDAIKNQLDQLEHVIFANFSHKPAIELCLGLKHILPKNLKYFFFTDNGSAAIEAALKMSFQYHRQNGLGEKRKFMALTGAYHGETLGALSISGMDLYGSIYEPLLLDVLRVEGPDCYRCPYGETRDTCACPCFEQVEKAFEKEGKHISGFIIEPLLQGAAGMKIYPALYLKKLREACSHYGIHLIVDEIATGFGRTGKYFACDHAGITPDIMCVSKGLTGGYLPMAIAVATEAIYKGFYGEYNEGKAFMHSHTYCGNPLAAAAGVAVLKILEEDCVIEKANENAPYFKEIINGYFEDYQYVGEVRRLGLINGIELVENRAEKTGFDPKKRIGYAIFKEGLKAGVILRPLGNVIYFNPPLNITRKEMAIAVERAFSAVTAVLGK